MCNVRSVPDSGLEQSLVAARYMTLSCESLEIAWLIGRSINWEAANSQHLKLRISERINKRESEITQSRHNPKLK